MSDINNEMRIIIFRAKKVSKNVQVSIPLNWHNDCRRYILERNDFATEASQQYFYNNEIFLDKCTISETSLFNNKDS